MPHKVAALPGWYNEVWTNGDLGAIPNFLAPNARTRGIIRDMPFAAGDLVDLVTMIREKLRPITVTLPITIEQDAWLSALVEVQSHALDSGDPGIYSVRSSLALKAPGWWKFTVGWIPLCCLNN